MSRCKICYSEFVKKAHNQIYCSGRCNAKSFSINNPDKIKAMNLRSYIKNRDKILQKQKDSERVKQYRKKYFRENKEKIRKIIDKEKHKVRAETQRKYGSLPVGIEYHHTTIPYHQDEWIGINVDDHYKLHSKFGGE